MDGPRQIGKNITYRDPDRIYDLLRAANAQREDHQAVEYALHTRRPDSVELSLTERSISEAKERHQMMTEEILIELWKIEDIPACDDGMILAHAFLKSCVSALQSYDSSNFNARFNTFIQHRSDCDKCNAV
jgi:hypothetical protein